MENLNSRADSTIQLSSGDFKALYNRAFMNPIRIRALLFDFDGLILDTETPEFETWRRIYAEHGQAFDPALWGRIVGGNGLTGFEPVGHLESLTGLRFDEDALRARHARESLAIVLRSAPLPGALDWITAARRLGLPLSVASSSPHTWVDGHLNRLGLLPLFDAVICSDDVAPGRAKPHPDLYLRAAGVLGVPPEACLVLEDSPNGVRAGRAAGCFVVAVPNPMTALLPFEGEHLRLASLADLSLEDLLARLA